MDKVFKAIGSFFKKIWEWIKSTAWVQPLLIVAIIFGLIFSINPIVNAIKSAVSDDNTGEFYEKHDYKFNSLFSGIKEQGPRYGKKGYLVSDSKDDVLVIYVKDSTTLESKVANFKNSEIGEGCKLYVVNFSQDRNQKSKYDSKEKKYVDDDGSIYYDYLLEQFQTAYNSDAYVEYNAKFHQQYGYDAFYPGFKDNDNKYEISSPESNKAVNDIHLPAAVKYHAGQIVDMRFSTGSSWSNYNSSTSNYDDIQILNDLWNGVK